MSAAPARREAISADGPDGERAEQADALRADHRRVLQLALVRGGHLLRQLGELLPGHPTREVLDDDLEARPAADAHETRPPSTRASRYASAQFVTISFRPASGPG